MYYSHSHAKEIHSAESILALVLEGVCCSWHYYICEIPAAHLTKVPMTIFNLHGMPTSDVPKHLPQTACVALSSFYSFFHLWPVKIWTPLYLPSLICHLSWGEAELKMSTRPVAVPILQVGCLGWVCRGGQSRQYWLLQPSDTADHQPVLLWTSRSSLLALLAIIGISMAQSSCLIMDIWCHLRLTRMCLLWLSAPAAGECYTPCCNSLRTSGIP